MNIQLSYNSLKRAIRKNPFKTSAEIKIFLYKTSTILERRAGQSPWRVGGSGGGVPVDTGNLLRSHKSTIKPFRLEYIQDDKKADYGKAVHKKRPWLRHVKDKSEKEIERLEKIMLKNIVDSLGKK